MSKTLAEMPLIEIVPQNLRSDPQIVAICAAFDAVYFQNVPKIKYCFITADIDNAKSEVVDLIAAERNCDFYDRSLPLENRRKLAKNAYLYKHFKGTAFAVRQIVIDAFQDAELREWFEYGGDPYHFRLIFDGEIPDEEILNKILTAVNAVKNIRSKLENIVASKRISAVCYSGGAVIQAKYQQIIQGAYIAKDYTFLGSQQIIKL